MVMATSSSSICYELILILCFLVFGRLGLETSTSMVCMFSGFVCTLILKGDLFAARDLAEELIFLLLLVKVGFSIPTLDLLSKQDWDTAIIPGTMELIATAMFGIWGLGFSTLQSMTLGLVLAFADASLVIPKLNHFRSCYPYKRMHDLMLHSVPLEVSYKLALFAILASLPGSHAVADVVSAISAVVMALLLGVAVGIVTAYSIHDQQALVILNMLILPSSVLSKNSMFPFRPEITVLAASYCFARYCERNELDKVAYSVDKVAHAFTLSGPMVLFTLVGTRMVDTTFPMTSLLSLMVVGLIFRFLGVLTPPTYFAYRRKRIDKFAFYPVRNYPGGLNVLFTFLVSLPRATWQAALCTVPLKRGLWNQKFLNFISASAGFYMFVLGCGGTLALEVLGLRLLRAEANSWHNRLNRALVVGKDPNEESGQYMNMELEEEHFESDMSDDEDEFDCSDPADVSLNDPESIRKFLLWADIRMVKWTYLKQLSEQGLPLPRRQEAEREGSIAFVSRQELEGLCWQGKFFTRTGGNKTEIHICAISHAWESMEHPDPYNFQLEQIVERFQHLNGSVWIFFDFVSLYQYPRDSNQVESFRKAMDGMHILYSHDWMHVEILDELTPTARKNDMNSRGHCTRIFNKASGQVESIPVRNLKENVTPFAQRGWCQSESEWSSLRDIVDQRVPTPPEFFKKRLDRLVFTHRSDYEAVAELHDKVSFRQIPWWTDL